MVHPSFEDYLSQLKRAEVALAIPADVDLQAHLDDISVPEQTTFISEEDYYYWLQIARPRWTCGPNFCSAGGDGGFRLFWEEAGSYFVRQLPTFSRE